MKCVFEQTKAAHESRSYLKHTNNMVHANKNKRKTLHFLLKLLLLLLVLVVVVALLLSFFYYTIHSIKTSEFIFIRFHFWLIVEASAIVICSSSAWLIVSFM